jgi:PAS domain S-box-containing protein
MKIKTQFAICVVIFSMILVFIAASVAVTEQQVTQLNAQEQVAGNIERGASSLNSISIDYFLYQENLQLSRWQSAFSSLSSDLLSLKLNTPQQKTLTSTVDRDLQRLNASFIDVVSYLQSAPRNVSIRIDPAFQIRWSGMAVQGQTLAFDASQLSSSIDDQAHQTNLTNIILIVSLVGVFGAFLATIYLIVFRRTLKSVANLQKGINTIGSGNLDYAIKIEGENEITELSYSFNQMTTNLKTVTASKSELEQEIAGRELAEIALRESEQRWATTLASIGDAIIATDLSGKIIFMNDVAEELTGWRFNDASMKPIKQVFSIINEHTRREVEDPVSKVLEKGMIVGLANHTVLIRKNKTEVPIDDSGAPVRDQDGKTTGVVLVFRDITDRKHMEDKLEEYTRDLEGLVEDRTKKLEFASLYSRSLIEASLDPLVTISPEGKITDVNKATEIVTGCSREQLIGSDFSDYFTEPKKAKTGYKQVFTEGFVRDYPLAIRHKSGKITDVLYNAALYKNEIGEVQGVFAAARDVTELRKAEEQAQEASKKLKDSERLAAIGATAGMVGHDIRNPLQAITSDVYLVKTDLASLPESEAKNNIKESLDEIEKNITYINKIVLDLQDFARPLTPKLEEVNLEKTVHLVLANLNIPGNVTVKHSIKKDFPKLKADQSYIQRILTNLSNNAIQAMPKGGKLTITASTKNGKAEISVEDTGEGISEEVRGRLFTPLMTTKSKGQGFGLAVVKRFTEGLGGTVTFESEVGKGTKFTIELPA